MLDLGTYKTQIPIISPPSKADVAGASSYTIWHNDVLLVATISWFSR